MPKVFLSYVNENVNLITKLASRLRQFGIDVWLDKDDIKPGQRWKGAIRQAISDGDFFLACFSKEYNDRLKTFMNEELILAIDELRLRPSDRTWFIPILLSPCEVPNREIGGGETLQSIQWVELYKDWESGIKKIVDVVYPNQYLEFSPRGYKTVLDKLPNVSARIALEAIFETIATKALRKEIFFVSGKGGIGKTILLKQLINRLESAQFLPIKYVFVDCYEISYSQPREVMKSIFEKLALPSSFVNYSASAEMLEKFSIIDPGAIGRLSVTTENDFFQDLNGMLNNYKLVLIFDTFERLYDNTSILAWFERLFAHADNLNIIFSSRPIEFATNLRNKAQALGFNITDYELTSIATFDVVQIIEQAKKDPAIKDKLSAPETIENLLSISAGNPLRLSLVIELMKEYEIDFDELWKLNSSSDELIKRLLR